MEYFIPIWWPSVSKIVQKVWEFVCPKEATVTKGGGAYW